MRGRRPRGGAGGYPALGRGLDALARVRVGRRPRGGAGVYPAFGRGYESCDEIPLELTFTGSGTLTAKHFRLGRQAMRFTDSGRSELVVNEFIRLRGRLEPLCPECEEEEESSSPDSTDNRQ